MKLTKTSIGKVGLVRVKGKSFEESIKKIPKGYRIMTAWEYLKLIDTEKDKLHWDLSDLYWTEFNGVVRACYFDNIQNFNADDRSIVNYNCAVRGVLVVSETLRG